MKTNIKAILEILLFGALAVPVLADTQFQVRTMARQDVPIGTGQCDIRLMIDNEADVVVQGNTVQIHLLSGREGRDAGSECNVPLPTRGVEGFNFQVIDRRGDVALLSAPSPRTGSSAVIRIRDSQGGEGRYHFRLSWIDRGYTTNDRYGFPGSYPPGGGYGRGGRWGTNQGQGRWDGPQGLRFSTSDAINMCSDAVRDNLSRDYRYNNAEVLNPRPDNLSGLNNLIIGDAIGRRGYFNQQFTFTCRVDYANGSIQSLDVRRR